MTSKLLEKVKASPLLNTPGEAEWWRVRGEDVGDMRKALAGFRSKSHEFGDSGLKIARLLDAMNGLDLGESILAGDIGTMKGLLDHCQRNSMPYYVASLLYYLRRFGVDVGDIRDDVRKLRKRAEKEKDLSSDFPGICHYCVQQLDGSYRPRERIIQSFEVFLHTARTHKPSGKDIAFNLFMLSAFGRPQEITEEDKIAFKADLKGLRAGHKGEELAMMLYHLNQIIPKMEITDETNAMPPLKHFRK